MVNPFYNGLNDGIRQLKPLAAAVGLVLNQFGVQRSLFQLSGLWENTEQHQLSGARGLQIRQALVGRLSIRESDFIVGRPEHLNDVHHVVLPLPCHAEPGRAPPGAAVPSPARPRRAEPRRDKQFALPVRIQLLSRELDARTNRANNSNKKRPNSLDTFIIT